MGVATQRIVGVPAQKVEGVPLQKNEQPLALFAAMLSLDITRYPPLNMSPQKQKDETLKALADQVAALAARQPVLMIFEDAHWIDPTTQEVLDQIVPRVADLAVLLVITYCPEYTPPWTGLGHVAPVTLTRLGRAQAATMVARVTGGKSLPDEVLDQIVAKTDGVPLFVEELTKTVIESGIVKAGDEDYTLTGQLTDLAIPSTLQDSLMARLDRLSPVKGVAQIGACIGRVFAHDLLYHSWALFSTWRSVLDGDLWPRWNPYLGLGMPLLPFYCPVGYTAAWPAQALGASPIQAVKFLVVGAQIEGATANLADHVMVPALRVG